MCGIVGFTGSAQAAPILLDGLSKLEYRGYDSAGLAVQNAAGKIEVVKAKGRLRVLSEMTDEGKAVQGSCGIGHTRWATHGEPSVVNAHPHYSRDQKIAVVHNGIIENYQELKTRLINKGFTFASQTDTEVVAQLLDYYYTGVSAGDSLDAITRMMMHVRGSYALGILFADQPGVVYAVRKDSPLIVGKAENGSLIASDVPALLKYTRTVYYIDNLEIARLTPDSIEFFNIDKEPVEKEASTIEWDAEAAENLFQQPVGAAVDVVGDDDIVAALQQREAGRYRGQPACERERAHAAVEQAHFFLQRAAGGVVAAGVGVGRFAVVDEGGGLVDGAGDGGDAAAVHRRGVGQQGFDMQIVIQFVRLLFYAICASVSHSIREGARRLTNSRK